MPETWAAKSPSSSKSNTKFIIIATVIGVIALLLIIGLVLGLAIGLTRNKNKNNSDDLVTATTTTTGKATTAREIHSSTEDVKITEAVVTSTTISRTTRTTTTKSTTTPATKKPCKNGAIFDPKTNKCICNEYTSGELCEIVAKCEDLPDDYEGCELLAEDENLDKEEFAAYCPKTAYCRDKPSTNV